MSSTRFLQVSLSYLKTSRKQQPEEKTEEEMVGPQRPQFVLFGSSIVQGSFSNGGWGAILADIYARKADIVLRGYNGWNSREAIQVLDKVFPKVSFFCPNSFFSFCKLWDLSDNVFEYCRTSKMETSPNQDAAIQPALVIVYFGGNDSMGPHLSHVPLPEYIENMRKIAKHIMSLSESTRLIFISPPPVNEALIRVNMSSLFGIRTNELCRNYSEACIQLCKDMDIKVIDMFRGLQKREDWLTACFTDGIHLSAEGSKIVAEEIMKVLKEAKWTPSLHWKSMPAEFPKVSIFDVAASDGNTGKKHISRL